MGFVSEVVFMIAERRLAEADVRPVLLVAI